MKRVGIIVKGHAVTRLRERFPGRTSDPAKFIYHEVMEALREGRRSRNEPRWVAGEARSRKPAARRAGTVRFVWEPSMFRAYVVIRQRANKERDADFDETWHVITTLKRREDA